MFSEITILNCSCWLIFEEEKNILNLEFIDVFPVNSAVVHT